MKRLKTELPKAFREQMQARLGAEFSDFEASLQEPAPVSIRINRWKTEGRTDALEGLPAVPWHPEGRYLPDRPVFTLDPLFHAGGYYVQEASSMVLYQALGRIFPQKSPLRILDLCASPGGKSTLLASWMPEGSLLVSTVVIHSRTGALQDNLERWGYAGTFTSSYDPAQFERLPGFFDLVLVDAPCSGEGLFRKDPMAVNEWSEEQVRVCAARQQRILSAARKLVRPGGFLIYSTCTYNSLENEGNAGWLAGRGMIPVAVDMEAGWNIASGRIGYQVYPHRVKGEGFYFAVFRQGEGGRMKPGVPRKFSSLVPVHKKLLPHLKGWLRRPEGHFHLAKPDQAVVSAPLGLEEDLLLLDHLLPKGVWFKETGRFKGTSFVPGHPLALHEMLSDEVGFVTLSRGECLSFLKKELAALPAGAPAGWLLVRYQGVNLGWVKNLGHRVNNYFPKDWRIRMDLRET